MKTKKLTLTALLTSVALIIFIIEVQLPTLVPIPGIKLGLANIVTFFALVWLGKKEAFIVLILRILLGSIFTGSLVTLVYSLSGGILAYCIMFLMLNFSSSIIPTSIVGAIAHNIGQILFAIIISNTNKIIYYLPILIISAVITGFFTGVVADLIIKRIKVEIK